MSGWNIADIIKTLVVLVPGFLIAVTVHEYAHALIAYRLGDSTAKDAGRLTLNPVSHLDPFGALVLIVTQMIGWAKPVPVNPRNFRNPRKDMIWVSVAGPVANLITATVLAVVFHVTLALFSMYGDSSGIPSSMKYVLLFLLFAVRINIGLGVFNLLPVPPLDGSKILSGILPAKQAFLLSKLEPYGILILLVLIMTNALDKILLEPIVFLSELLLGKFI